MNVHPLARSIIRSLPRFVVRGALVRGALVGVAAVAPLSAGAAHSRHALPAADALRLVPDEHAPSLTRVSTASLQRGAGTKTTKPRPATRTKEAATSPRRKRTTTRARSSRRKATVPVRPVLHHTTPRGEHALAADLATLLAARVRSGEWGVIVSSVTRGDTLFSHNADALMLPASTLKLYTAALAFEKLGPNHQFETSIFRTGPVNRDGTLEGSLVIRGGGDPALSGRFVGGSPDGPMRTLARIVADAGIKRITGDVIGDASAFDGKRIPDGWLARYINDSYAARVSALSLNENLLHVVVTPGKSGAKASVTLRPATVAYPVVNQTRTSGAGRTAKVTVSRTSDGTVVVRGSIGARSEPRVYVVVVEDPALFATGAFKQAEESEGVKVDGSLRLSPTPVGAVRIGGLASPPLWSLASAMNRESINHFAELLFRNASRASDPVAVGSAERGNLQLRDFMTRKVGALPGAVSAADGSGLSSLNRITPRSLVQLLGYAHHAPWGREFHQSLPVAGESELLRHRMKSTPAQGNLHAKTGTTNDVIALGGYVTSQGGELLAFSFLYNGRDRWNAKETIDAMGATLAGFGR